MSENNYKDSLINNRIVFRGVILGLIILIVISILLAVILSNMGNFNITSFSRVLFILNILLIIFTGFFIARRVENNGWLNGGLGGILLMGLILLIGSINISLSPVTVFIYLFLALIAGSIGGIIGINI